MQVRLSDLFCISKGVVVDWLTALLALLSLVLLLRWKIDNLLLVAGAGIVGLLVYG